MIYVIISVAILVFDIITKHLTERFLMPIDTLPIWNSIFHLTYVENKGMAFGIFQGGRIFFIVVSVIVLVLLALLLIKTEKPLRTVWLKGGTALIMSGAVGNLIERILKGYVVDFLDFRIIDFPVFNVADIAVCVGAGMIIVHFLFAEERAKTSKEKAEEPESE